MPRPRFFNLFSLLFLTDKKPFDERVKIIRKRIKEMDKIDQLILIKAIKG